MKSLRRSLIRVWSGMPQKTFFFIFIPEKIKLGKLKSFISIYIKKNIEFIYHLFKIMSIKITEKNLLLFRII